MSGDDLIGQINNLPLKERIDVLEKAIINLPPEARYTVLEFFRPAAIVLIYDQEGVNLSSPCALVIYNDKCEQINILASVRKNADSIRHPAIALAVRRWANVIAAQAALARNKARTGNAQWDFAKGNFFKRAQQHLQAIGQALKDASRSQNKMKAAVAFAPILWTIDEASGPYLKVCWKVIKEHKGEITRGVDRVGEKYSRTNRDRCRVLRDKVLEYVRYHGFEDEPLDAPFEEATMQTFELLFEPIFRFFEDPSDQRSSTNRNSSEFYLEHTPGG